MRGRRRTPVKVSVVIPVFNDVRVRRALDSVFAQRIDCELETIVIDAGSTDGTLDVLARYSDSLNVCISEPDGGIYDGMNKGIGHATGEVISILNADDQYADEDVLQDVVDVFQQRPDIEICYGNIVYVNDDGQSWRRWRSGANRRFKWYLGWRPPHPAFYVRRRTYDSYGLFNLDFPVASDYEMQLRLLFVHGLGSIHIDRTLVKMAPGGNSNRSPRKIFNGNLESLRAWRQHGLRGGMFIPVLKLANKIVQFKAPPTGHRAHRAGGESAANH